MKFGRGIKRPPNLRAVVDIANQLAASGQESEHIGLITVRLNTTALKLRRLRDQKAVMTSISRRIREGLGVHVRAIREGLEDFTIVAVTPTEAVFKSAVERISVELSDPHELRGKLPGRRKKPQLFNVPATLAGAGLQVDDIDHKRLAEIDGESREFDGEELIQRSNIVQHAIARGWGIFDSEDKRYQEAKQDLLLIKAMPEALSNGEFTVVSQPIVDANGSWVASESLVRWNSAEPEPKFISPEKFIALADEHGFIGDLGHWILRESCEAAMAWHREHPSENWPDGMAKPPEGQAMPIISVNVAPKQLEDGIFAKEVMSVLEDTGLSPEFLQLELTEGKQVDLGSSQIQELAALGVRFSIDDYGTQTANVDYLVKAAKKAPLISPITNVKIDKLFLGDPEDLRTREELEQHNLDHIGNTTHLVSRVLPGADCTIEGVEKAKWIRALAARGCKKFQGFGIARPGPYGPPPVLDLGPERSPRPGNGPKRGRKQEKPPARHRDRGSQDRRGGARRTSRRR